MTDQQLYSNNAVSALSVALTSGEPNVTIPVADLAKFADVQSVNNDFEMVTLNDGVNIEIVKVIDKLAATLLVLRAQEGTIARNFAIGTIVYAANTRDTLERFRTADEINAANIVILQAADVTLQNNININNINIVANDADILVLQGEVTDIKDNLVDTLLTDDTDGLLTNATGNLLTSSL